MRRKYTVKQVRCLNQMTQPEMAEKLNMSLKSYNTKENDPSQFRLKELLLFCKICKISIYRLIFLPENDTFVSGEAK